LARLHSISYLSADSGCLLSGRKISTFENRSLANPNCDYLPTLEEGSQRFNGIWTSEGHPGGRLGWVNSWRRIPLWALEGFSAYFWPDSLFWRRSART
jgi:hypothetical protein